MTETQQDPGPQPSTETGSTRSSGGSVRQRAMEAYDGARQGVSDAGRRATDAIDEAPLIALAGGLAAGALLATLLPRSEAEKRMMRPVGEKLGSRARAAAEAAREAGQSRLKELGLTPDAGADALKSVMQKAGEAARSSAKAAADTAKRG